MKNSVRTDFRNSNYSYGGDEWAVPLTPPIIKGLSKAMYKLLIETTGMDNTLNYVYQ